MGLGRKKSHYVSFGEFAKAGGIEEAESTASDAGNFVAHETNRSSVDGLFGAAALCVGPETLEATSTELDESPLAPQVISDPDVEAHLTDIAARISEVRRHISNARVEAIAQQETLGKSTTSAEAAVIVVPQSVPSESAGLDRRFVDDIDESDVESIENRFFEERPVSIEESMRQADESHVRHRKSALAFAAIAVVLVVGLGLVAFGSSGVSSQNSKPAEGDAQSSVQGEDLSDAPPPSARHYQTSEYGEAGVSVYEVMEFSKDGLCSKMTLEATFSNGAAAEEFLADMRETHGSNCVESYVDGTTGVVVIDVSGQEMTKEEYSANSGVEVEDPNAQEIPEELTT